MSDAIFEAKTNGLATKNDALRDAFAKDGTRAFLVKRGGQTEKFTVIRELTSGWYAKFNEYRGQMTFKIATTDETFADDISQASFVPYGVPDGDGKIEVFSIDPDKRDVVAPNGSSVYWKVFATKVANERFTIPA